MDLLNAFIDCETCSLNNQKKEEIKNLQEYPGVNSPLYPSMLQTIMDKYRDKVCALHNIRK